MDETNKTKRDDMNQQDVGTIIPQDEEQQIIYDDNPTMEEESDSPHTSEIPRLIKRNLPHHQSKQKFSVKILNASYFWGVRWLMALDWFHVLLRMSTILSVFLLLLVWTLCILAFALIYRGIDRRSPDIECGLGTSNNPIEFHSAFAFSLETCTTVGYGLPSSTNAFFENCPGVQVAIFFQMVWSMMFNAFLFAFFFARLATCERRGVQVLFSDKAIVEKRDGKWVFHTRIYDMDSALPLVEAHVRMYCVSWLDYEKQPGDEIQPQLLHTMRILQPDDDLGAVLFTSIPNTVTHHIDAYSPIMPSNLRKEFNNVHGHGLFLREVDGYTQNGGGMACPVCGESYGSLQNLKRHIEYQKMLETRNKIPVDGSHQDERITLPVHQKPLELRVDDIHEHLADKEIMVVVEGIEPQVSGSFQALQSYKLEDIVFGGRYAPCMSQKDGKVFVDLGKFHQILKPSVDSQRIYIKKNI